MGSCMSRATGSGGQCPTGQGRRCSTRPSTSLIFIDELSTSTPSQQAAALKIISERELGGRKLSPRCRIVAAANPPESSAGGQELAPPTANRFVHVLVGEDVEDFCANFPSLWRGAGSGIELLPEPSEDDRPRAGADRRIRQAAARAAQRQARRSRGRRGALALQAHLGVVLPAYCRGARQRADLAAAAATVGEAAATELAAFIRECRTPGSGGHLADPESAPLPERGDILYAAMSAAAAAAIARPTPRPRPRGVGLPPPRGGGGPCRRGGPRDPSPAAGDRIGLLAGQRTGTTFPVPPRPRRGQVDRLMSPPMRRGDETPGCRASRSCRR
jgi:hypothetical protein